MGEESFTTIMISGLEKQTKLICIRYVEGSTDLGPVSNRDHKWHCEENSITWTGVYTGKGNPKSPDSKDNWTLRYEHSGEIYSGLLENKTKLIQEPKLMLCRATLHSIQGMRYFTNSVWIDPGNLKHHCYPMRTIEQVINVSQAYYYILIEEDSSSLTTMWPLVEDLAIWKSQWASRWVNRFGGKQWINCWRHTLWK